MTNLLSKIALTCGISFGLIVCVLTIFRITLRQADVPRRAFWEGVTESLTWIGSALFWVGIFAAAAWGILEVWR